MIQILWDTRGYFFWLLMASLLVFIMERLFPWRRDQKVIRRDILQDIFFLFFNGHYAGILVATAGGYLFSLAAKAVGYGHQLESLHMIAGWPVGLQFVFFLLFKDFVEWWIHRSLHTIPWLWSFHKLHHSIREMDWIGNFRFHWMEIAVYKGLSYFPLVVMGADENILLPIAVLGTLIGHLNHANIRLKYGPLKYVLNSPDFHIWHHDRHNHHPHGQNFAILFSFWDRFFGTFYWPADRDQPETLGFEGDDRFPGALWRRLLFPMVRK